jgi:hypothetical protein
MRNSHESLRASTRAWRWRLVTWMSKQGGGTPPQQHWALAATPWGRHPPARFAPKTRAHSAPHSSLAARGFALPHIAVKLRARNARALGAALVACSRRLRTATAVKLCARDARSVTLVKSSVTLLDRDASNAIGEGYTLRPLEEISSRARFVWCHPREDIEFVIGDDEVLEEAALAARHRPGGDPPAGLLRDI